MKEDLAVIVAFCKTGI